MIRLRLMQILVALTVASLSFLVYAIYREQPVYDRIALGPLLPNLGSRLDEVAMIELTFGLGMSGTQIVTLERRNGKWVLPSRQNFPAHQELVNELLLNLTTIEKLAPRTALAKWHIRLGLTVPEKLGAAIRFRLSDASGANIAGILLGKPEASEVEQKQAIQQIGLPQSNFYVREIDEDQSWLARGRLPRNKDIAVWIDPALPLPELNTIERISISHHEEAVVFAASEPAAQAILSAMATLRPVDVTPSALIDFSNGQNLTLQQQDGGNTGIAVVSTGSHIWARFSSKEDWAYKFDGSAAAALLPLIDASQDTKT